MASGEPSRISLPGGYVLRPVTPADVAATDRLNHRVPLGAEWYAWFEFDNPFREGRPAGWVVDHPETGIVGKIWLSWWPVQLDGRPVPSAFGRDLYVDPRARGAGLGTILVRHMFESCGEALVLGSSANRNSIYFWQKFGGFTIAGGEDRYQRALAPSTYVRGLLGRFALLRRLGAAPRQPDRAGGPRPTAASLKFSDPADPSESALLEFLARSARSVDITTRRDEGFLRWRYQQCPVRDPQMRVVRRQRRIVAFLGVQTRQRSSVLGARVAEILDLVTDFSDHETAGLALRAAIEWARAQRAVLIEMRGTHPALRELFARQGWVRRVGRLNPFVCYSPLGERWRLRQRRWHLVWADGDPGVT